MQLRPAALLILAILAPVRADIRTCACDLKSPGIAENRECSLCLVAEQHDPNELAFVVKDASPAKPNRWLALARSAKADGPNPLTRLSAEERLALWNTAITKARELWGDSWGIAMNSDLRRTQCHLHVHIGKLLDGQETESAAWADGPAQLPVISDGAGFWFHPVGGRLHVHIGEEAAEYVLMR